MKKFYLLALLAVGLTLGSCVKEDLDEIRADIDRLKTELAATTSRIEAKITQIETVTIPALEEAMKAADAALKTALETQIGTVQKALDDYKTSTDEQIKAHGDKLTALETSLDALQKALEAEVAAREQLSTDLTKKVDDAVADLQGKIDALLGRVEKLEGRIQSIVYVPKYDDGKVMVDHVIASGDWATVEVDFLVSPKSAVPALKAAYEKDSKVIKVQSTLSQTRAVGEVSKLDVESVSFDAAKGAMNVVIDPLFGGDDFLFRGATVQVVVAISDGNNDVLSNAVPMQVRRLLETVDIPAGTFLMGSPASEPGRAPGTDEAQHEVTLTKGFRMAKYLVTIDQFLEFLNSAHPAMKGLELYTWPNGQTGYAGYVEGYGVQPLFVSEDVGDGLIPVYYDAADEYWYGYYGDAYNNEHFPMTGITWYGAKAFAAWVGGKLATEAQWEYACRAGSTTAHFWGATFAPEGTKYVYTNLDGPTWNAPEGQRGEVDALQPNPWGIYNMPGSLEWCEDWWADAYGLTTAQLAAGVTDPVVSTAPATAGKPVRVMRGCGNGNLESFYRSAGRNSAQPWEQNLERGIRVVFDK